MTQFVHLLTVAAIFVHATMGCCAHEAHSMEAASCQPSACCGCEHSGSDQEGLQQDDHSSQQPVPHECSHTDCNWPAPEVRNCVDLVLLDALLNPTENTQWISALSFDFVLGKGGYSSALLPDVSLHTVPLRAHLAKCVLLI